MIDNPGFPDSERLRGVESMVTGRRGDLSEVVVSGLYGSVTLRGDEALKFYDALAEKETVSVPDPYHYEVNFGDPAYTVELRYSGGGSDVIGAEGLEREIWVEHMKFTRKTGVMGANGDVGFVYFVNSDLTFLELIHDALS